MSTATGAFSCPQCGRRFRWKSAIAEKTVYCKCERRFRVPAEPEPGPTGPMSPELSGGSSLALTEDAEPPATARNAELALGPASSAPDDPSPFFESLSQAIEGDGDPATPGNGKCPGCGTKVGTGAAVCVTCGARFDRRGRVKRGAAASLGITPEDGRRLTGIGLLVHLAGVLMALIGVGTMGVTILASGLEDRGAAGYTLAWFAIVSGLLAMGLGPGMGLLMPGGVGRAPAVVAVLAVVAGLVMLVIAPHLAYPDLARFAPAVLGLAAMACLLAFYRELAEPLGDADALATARSQFGLLRYVVLATVLGGALPVASHYPIPYREMILSIGALVLVLALLAVGGVFLVRYLLLTGQVAVGVLRGPRAFGEAEEQRKPGEMPF